MSNPTEGRAAHPSLQSILRYFECDHLPPHLRAVAESFRTLAYVLVDTLPGSAELTVALRKFVGVE